MRLFFAVILSAVIWWVGLQIPRETKEIWDFSPTEKAEWVEEEEMTITFTDETNNMIFFGSGTNDGFVLGVDSDYEPGDEWIIRNDNQ